MTGGVLSFATGEMLSVTGATIFGLSGAGGPYVGGAGTLVTTGMTTLAPQTNSAIADLQIAGFATWENSGTLDDGGLIDIGNGYDQGATLTNQADGVFDLTSPDASIVQLNPNDIALFNNAGLLEKTEDTGISSVAATLTNTGTIDIASGSTLTFTGGGSFGGAIIGAGSVMFEGGTTTLTASVVPAITVTSGVVDLATQTLGQVDVTGGGLGVIAASTISGSLTMTNSTLSFATGETLSVTGATIFGLSGAGGPYVGGTGTLVTTGMTTLAPQTNSAIADLQIAGFATWENSGTLDDGGLIDIGNSYDRGATLTNQADGVFDLTSPDASIVQLNPNDIALFNNAGLLEKTEDTGTSSVAAAIASTGLLEQTGDTASSIINATVTNTGTIAVKTGTLEFTGLLINDGTASATNGATLEFAASLVAQPDAGGILDLASGGSARFDAGASTGESVSFSDSTGHLLLAAPGQVDASISGFQSMGSQSDSIDLLGLSGLSKSYSGTESGGTLTLSEGTTIEAQLQFVSSYTVNSFMLSPDTATGTLIIEIPLCFSLVS